MSRFEPIAVVGRSCVLPGALTPEALFEAVRATPSVRVLVNVTSDKCYENNHPTRGYREEDPMGGGDPYSASNGCAANVGLRRPTRTAGSSNAGRRWTAWTCN